MANTWNADMTLDEATELRQIPSWACACCGPPMRRGKALDSRCFCALTMDQVQSLHRAAHIVAKLMADRADMMPDYYIEEDASPE